MKARFDRFVNVAVLGLALTLAPGVVQAALILDFPSPDSVSEGPTGSGALGAGGGGVHFITGDDLTETFVGTGLAAATSSRWEFTMDDFTAAGVINTFDIEINGAVVGSFDFTWRWGIFHDCPFRLDLSPCPHSRA